jgi:hypothetical protein
MSRCRATILGAFADHYNGSVRSHQLGTMQSLTQIFRQHVTDSVRESSRPPYDHVHCNPILDATPSLDKISPAPSILRNHKQVWERGWSMSPACTGLDPLFSYSIVLFKSCGPRSYSQSIGAPATPSTSSRKGDKADLGITKVFPFSTS